MGTSKKTKKQNTKPRLRAERRTTTKSTTETKRGYLRDEVLILGFFAVCVFLQISHFGICGYIGNMASAFLFGLFGCLAYITPILLFVLVTFVMSNKGKKEAYVKIAAVVIMYTMCSTFFQLIFNPKEIGQGLGVIYKSCSTYRDGGGILGGMLANLLCPAVGVVGTYIIIILLFLISFIIISGKSFVGAVKEKSAKVYQTAKEDAQRRKERIEEEKEKEKMISPEPEKTKKRKDRKVSGVIFDTGIKKKERIQEQDEVHEIWPQEEPERTEELVINRETPLEEDLGEVVREELERKKRITKESQRETEIEVSHVETEIQKQEEKPKKEYKFPPLALLSRGRAGKGDSDAHLRETARKLEQTLQNFNVNVTVTNVSCGPAVTRYELQPEMGVKVSKIVALADDIKLNLAASDIRIEAPIPGKAAVGIEVPNKENASVMLRDLLETPEFKEHPSKIAFATGRDIGGKAIVADIAKMPHVLIAGATGSGKSVCINTLIMSILYKATPDEVKMIMIDPKVVELKVYNGIPHLLIPVVTDPKKAAGALNWAVEEMTRRYQLFADCNVRDLKGYNEKVESLQFLETEDKPKKLPQIVIIVDELADLMMVAPGEVEDAICRLAQLARACGIHLVLATQRPSVNVITGLIKANMPSRIAFAVSSGVDSRTIIDMNGAEKLLGKGDMLFYPTGYPKPVRVQGCFVSDQEVQSVVDYLINNGHVAEYQDEITQRINSVQTGAGAGFGGASDERDVYFVEAGKFVIEKDKASIGMLQRVFKIGFNRAARIMDQLAEAGVVGEEEGTKPRKVLMTPEEFERFVEESL